VGRGGRFRAPPQNAINGNSQGNLEEKLANLSITEVSQFTASCFSAFSRDNLFRPFALDVPVEWKSCAPPGK